MKYLFGLILLVGLTLVSFDVFGCNPRVYNQVNCAPYYPPQTIIIEVPVVRGYGHVYPQVGVVGYPQVGVVPYGARQSRYSRFGISGHVGISNGNRGYYGRHGNNTRGDVGVGFHYETGKAETR